MTLRGEAFLSAFETIQVIIAIGSYSIALITLVVKVLRNDNKK
ncbi:putative holin-like toxin [Atopostipes suicloacalis]|nr:putative holin-like toxin [Atopostipes suicloacalis]